MTDIAFLTTIKDLLDINDVETATIFLEGEIRYRTLQEVKSRPTTYIFPYDVNLMDNILEATRHDSMPEFFTKWLTDFKKVTSDAEIIIVHPVTMTALHAVGYDMDRIECDTYWDSPEQKAQELA